MASTYDNFNTFGPVWAPGPAVSYLPPIILKPGQSIVVEAKPSSDEAYNRAYTKDLELKIKEFERKNSNQAKLIASYEEMLTRPSSPGAELIQLRHLHTNQANTIRDFREANQRQDKIILDLRRQVAQQESKIKNLIGDRYYVLGTNVVEFSHGKLKHTAWTTSSAAAEGMVEELNRK